MVWVKRGLIIVPAQQAPWIGTHAALPVVRRLDDRDRVYFSSRDAAGRSHIGYVDLSLESGDLLAVAPRSHPLAGPAGCVRRRRRDELVRDRSRSTAPTASTPAGRSGRASRSISMPGSRAATTAG